MKRQILLILFSKWKALESKTKKKIYIFLGFFSVFALAIGVTAVVMLIKVGSAIYDKTIEVGQSAILSAPALIEHQVNAPAELAALGRVNIVNCSERMQSLLALNTWLNTPLSQTLDSILADCFYSLKSQQACDEGGCAGSESHTQGFNNDTGHR